MYLFHLNRVYETKQNQGFGVRFNLPIKKNEEKTGFPIVILLAHTCT